MFAGSYKTKAHRLYLSRLGMVGSVISFLMLTLMIQWPLLQSEREFSNFSLVMLWVAPVLISFGFAGIYYGIARWRATKNNLSYSFGVTHHWTLASLLPVAALVSLAEYFMLQPVPTAFIHSAGLIIALGVYLMLLVSHRTIERHNQILLFSYGFYALAATLQVFLMLL